MKSPFISLRLYEHHRNDRLMDELMEVLERQKGSCDEIWFSSEYGFPKLSTHRQSAAAMADTAARVRAAGLVASLQISNTIGHGEYHKPLDFSGIEWQKMVGPDGTVTPYSNCPRDPDFKKYLRETVLAYAAWKPDYVWVDDDLRMSNHFPVNHGCFCERCINDLSNKFAKCSGEKWTRETLAAAINDPEDPTWRVNWVKFNQESLAGVARVIAEALKEVSPDSRIGYQHPGFDWCLYSGADYKPTYDVFYEVSGKPPLTRPGGGFYTDFSPRGMIDKALAINLQNTRLPEYVTESRPEIENFTHTQAGKTPHGTVVESTLDLAYGCNALSFATLMVDNERPLWHERTQQRIAEWKPYWERFVAHNEGTAPAGLRPAYGRNHIARKLRPNARPFTWDSGSFGSTYMMTTYGMPVCWNDSGLNSYILYPGIIDGLSDDEIRDIFSGGVLTDGETMIRLINRGLGDLTGVTAERLDGREAIEKFTSDPINGDFKGSFWQQFFIAGNVAVHRLHTTNASARILGEYMKQDGTMSGTATMAIETSLGGSAVISGFNLWEVVVNSAKRAQLLGAADWISGGRLPAIIETASQVLAVPRTDKTDKLHSVTLLNVSIDDTTPLRVRLRNPAGKNMAWTTPAAPDTALQPHFTADGGEVTVEIPPIGPWGIGSIEIK